MAAPAHPASSARARVALVMVLVIVSLQGPNRPKGFASVVTPTIARRAEPRLNGARRPRDRNRRLIAHINDIVGFWGKAGPDKWFKKVTAFDEAIRLKFEPTHHAAARGEYDR